MKTTIHYIEVAIYGFKAGNCVVCGKNAQRRKKFFQTINPFNKNTDGITKTREDILVELHKRRADWLREPLYHEKCEGKEEKSARHERVGEGTA